MASIPPGPPEGRRLPARTSAVDKGQEGGGGLLHENLLYCAVARFYYVDAFSQSLLLYPIYVVDRIDSWIRGVSGEALLAYRYEKIFSLLARAGLERIDGDEERFEVNPAEEWVSIGAEWNLWDYFWIQHSWSYRSDARWNLRSENPFVVKGSWYWDASFTQNFPKYGLSLSATLVHSLGKNLVQVPNGGEDVTRFFCNIVKKF